MSFTITDFLQEVDKINSNNYNYGNDILYSSFKFSKDILPPPNTTKLGTELSSAMSIIGKSYSADPTRSVPKGVLQNNGTGDAFGLLAGKIVEHPDYEDLYNRVKDLSNKTFNYRDDVNDDKEILINTIFCVALLNHILRNLIYNIAKDKGIDEVGKNTISFCSKFLHFLCPNVFFIKDSISLSNGNNIFKNLEKCTSLSKPTVCYSDISLKFYDDEKEKEENAIKEYLAHVIRAYSVAKFLFDNQKVCYPQIGCDPLSSSYMPRLVDSIFMSYKI